MGNNETRDDAAELIAHFANLTSQICDLLGIANHDDEAIIPRLRKALAQHRSENEPSGREFVRRNQIAAHLDLTGPGRDQFVRRFRSDRITEGYGDIRMDGYLEGINTALDHALGRVASIPDHVPFHEPDLDSHLCVCHLGNPPCSHCTDCTECDEEGAR